MQRRFHGWLAALSDAGGLRDRVTEHVHEDHAAALQRRKAHEGSEAGGRDVTLIRNDHGIGHRLQIHVGPSSLLSPPTPQKVHRRIVCDAKDQSFQIGNRSGVGISLDRIGKCFVRDVLSIDDRARHAGAVAMQLWAQFAQKAVECDPRVGRRDCCQFYLRSVSLSQRRLRMVKGFNRRKFFCRASSGTVDFVLWIAGGMKSRPSSSLCR